MTHYIVVEYKEFCIVFSRISLKFRTFERTHSKQDVQKGDERWDYDEDNKDAFKMLSALEKGKFELYFVVLDMLVQCLSDHVEENETLNQGLLYWILKDLKRFMLFDLLTRYLSVDWKWPK